MEVKDVIESGISFVPVTQTTTAEGSVITTIISSPVTAEEKIKKKNDMKNAHVVVWRNKPDLDTMSIDDLYNNFKIVEQEVKRTTSSNSSSQNMDFMSSSSTNSTNEFYTTYRVSIASTQSSTAITKVSTASSQTGTANLSDVTVYAFLATQSNGGPRNQDSRNRYQDRSRRNVNMEETPPKAMVAIDGVGFDWSYMAEDEFESYGPKSCEKESTNASEDIPNEPKEYPNAPLVKDRVSDNKDFSVESPVLVEKKIDVPTIAKVEFVRPQQQEKLVRKPVRYAEMYMLQGLRRN
nr:hypothetical protein [Tanacetum cinerariifolium]